MTADNPSRRWTAERVRERLGKLEPRAPLQSSPVHQGYLDAAAVVESFEPLQLAPLGLVPADPGAAIQQLLTICSEDCRYASRWRLRREPRIAALRQLVARRAVADALAANPQRPDEPAQRLLEAALTGRSIDVAKIAPDELAAAASIVALLDGIVPGLPDAQAIANRIALEDILGPLRALATCHFRGRQAELGRLRALLNEPVAGPPLVIHGPGGMGKSTLIARFILDQVDRDPASRIPFAYLDFDRQDLSIRDTMVLIAEIVRQLGIQYPTERPYAEATRTRILESQDRVLGSESYLTRKTMVGGILELLRSVGAHDHPFLLVLDTFEEVQYSSRSFLDSLWELFDVLRNALPRLTTVIAGRAGIAEPPATGRNGPRFAWHELELGELDREAAIGFLGSRGIQDARIADALFVTFGGNPLSLWLASDIARRGEIPDLERVFLPFAQQAQVQGQLYRRILAHIHDPDVRKLAHPGLILRVITPSLIQDVLAAPCGVAVPDADRALALFRELEREISLVYPEARGVLEPMLRHREDVRRVMLGLLRSDLPDRIHEIHRRAVEFHASRDEPWNRAEEIYHRLALCEDGAMIDPRWIPGIEDQLRGALDELEPHPRAYLATRLGIDLDERTRRHADLEAWERDTQKRVKERLFVGRPEQLKDALNILAERTERIAGSPLILLEASVLERLERLDEARKVAAAALTAIRATRGDVVEALRTLARIDEALHREHDAVDELGEAMLLARQLGDTAALLDIALRRLRLLEALGASPVVLHEAMASVDSAAARVPADQRSLETKISLSLATSDAPRVSAAQQQRLCDAMASAFPRREAVERLVLDSLDERLEAITSPHSLTTVMFELIRWAMQMGRLEHLVTGALRERPQDAELRAIASELFPQLRAGAPSAGELGYDLLFEIRRAAQTAGLARSRAALLYGLPRDSVVKLPAQDDPMQQCLSDLAAIAQLDPLRDGTLPLQIWLENAIVLAGPRREAGVFRRALDELGTDRHTRRRDDGAGSQG